MSHTAVITSAVRLSESQLQAIKTTLGLKPGDELVNEIDPQLIAGMKVSVAGQTVDLSVKRQLADIVGGISA